jgi:hypothetical protein
MRRVALLAGVLGTALGFFASYVVLRDAKSARARYRTFERLATSDAVQRERMSWLLARLPPSHTPASSEITKDTSPGEALGILRSVHEDKQREGSARITPGARKEILNVLNKQKDLVSSWRSFSPERREELLAKMTPEQKHELKMLIERQIQQDEQDPYAAIAKPFSAVNRGGIKAIHWSKDLGVESIETDEGATLYPSKAPTLGPYFLAAIFPLLGFAVPWCSVRTLAWVGAGFFESKGTTRA